MEEKLLLLGSVCPAEAAAEQGTGACPRLWAPIGTQRRDGACEGLPLLLGEAHGSAEAAPWGRDSNPRSCSQLCLAFVYV